MWRWGACAALLAGLLLGSPAWPAPFVDRAIGTNLTCAAPPCDFELAADGLGQAAIGDARAGNKTVQIDVTQGTATVQLFCRLSNRGGVPSQAVLLASVTDATDGAPFDFVTGCQKLWLKITACAASCKVSAWLVGQS